MRRFVILAILICSTVIPAHVRAQTTNTISTVAGGGANAPTATAAYLSGSFGIARDTTNHVTYLSIPTLSVVYKVDAAGNIAPYAGNGILGFSGDGFAATSAELNNPNGIAVDAGGNLFIADSQNNRIRRVDFATHVITTVAGSGNQYNGVGFFGGFSPPPGQSGPATSALMSFPAAVAVDGNGNLFIADSGNNVIRKVDNSPAHLITTYAGNGVSGTPGTANGDGGAATAAQLSFPDGVAVDSTGNVFIGDFGDSVVRKVDTSATPIITTYAGSAANIFTYSGDGGPANLAGLNSPQGVSLDSSGNLYIADTFNNRIRKVDNTLAHDISTLAGSAGICLVTTGCGDGAAATSAVLNSPSSVAVDATNGNVFFCDSGTQRYRVVVPGATPIINPYAGGGSGGDGSAATSAIIGGPPFVTVDAAGDLLVVDAGASRIRKVNASTNVITNFAGNGVVGPPGLTNGDGGPATQANLTQITHGIAVGPSGNVYFIDRSNFIVRRIDTAGTITRVAGSYGGRCAGANLPACGDGGAATSALLRAPTGIAVDSLENIYISDGGLNRIRVFTVGGNISNFAGTGTAGATNGPALTTATFNAPWGIAFDANGNLFVADAFNNLIRKIDNTAAHNVTTYAFNGQPTFGGDGGNALSASMQSPQQVAVDSAGNVYVGGGFDNVVQRIDVNDQTVITVAGDLHNLDGGFRASDDGGPSTKALISNFGLAIFKDTTNNTNILYIADQGNNRIRKVDLAPVAQLTPAALQNFGPVLVGDASAPQILTINNNGLDDLTVTNVAATAGFGIASNFCINLVTLQPVVSPGGSCFLAPDFVPPIGTSGVINGNLTFNTNDPANASVSLLVTGTAVAPPGFPLAVTLTGAGAGTVSSSSQGLVGGTVTLVGCPPSGPGAACTVNFAAGEVVTLIAVPTAGSTLMQWNVNGSTTACPATQITCAVTMSAAQNVMVTFATATISVSGLGNGTGTIADNLTPHLINCTYNGTTTSGTCSATYPPGTTTVTLNAAATGTSSFAGWLGFCGVTGINSSGTGPCTLDLNLTIVPTLAGTLATAVFSGPAQTFKQGQVFVGTVDGMIFVYNADGSLAQVLNSASLGGGIAGMNFDTSGNLFAANFGANTVERFVGGTATPTTFGGPYNSAPIGLVIDDPTNNVFVGQSSGDNTLLEFSSAGTLTSTFFPAYDQGGIGYLELLDDSARVLYTSSTQTGATAGSVRNYDIANNHQNPDFAINLPGGPAFAVRELSDKSVLVANSTKITHLDPNGNVITTPSLTPPAGGLFFALNLDPTGTSFWTGDALSGKVYQVQISSGTVLNTINTGLGFSAKTFFDTIFGIAVFGQPQSGGADLAVTVTAPASDPVNTQMTYTATVKNNGPLAAAGVSVTDTFPAGVTVNSAASTQGPCTVGQTVTCTVGPMNSGATVTVTIKVTPTQAMTLLNTITANATTPDPNPGNNSFTTSTTVLGPTLATITMSAPSSSELGVALTYQIQVSNPGGATLIGIAVTDTLPGGLNASSLSTGCTGTNSITCTIGTLTPGQIVNLSITIVPTTSPATLTNSANVTGGNSTSVSTNVITGGVPLAVEVDSANSADFITTNPSSGICTQAQTVCTSYFPSGTMVTVTANGPGFVGWSVNNLTTTCPGTGTCTVTLTTPQLVIAGYSSIGLLSSQLTGVVGFPFGADLSNGVLGGVPPYTITLTGTVPNGLTFTAPFISGVPTAAGVTPLTVNITDSIGEKGSVPVTLTIINAPTGQEALANGNYAILFHLVDDATGASNGSLFDVAGSLHFNGKGVIDSGTLDTNSNTPGKGPQTLSVTGTYTIGADHRGLITLQSVGKSFAFLAMSVGDVYQGVAHTAHIIEFDDNTGTGERGAGTLRWQDPSAWTAASFAGPSGSGTYIYGGTGQDPTFARFTELGLITVNNSGAFSSGSGDSNDNGTVASLTFTGTYSDGATLISSTTGRTAWTFNTGTTAASYIIDANNVVFITTNPGTSAVVFAGTAERQLNTAPFDATFLSGPDVVAKQGPSNAGKNGDVFIGVATFTPAAGPNPTTGTVVVTKDANAGGVITLEGSENNTFAIAPSGRFVTTIPGDANQPISYLSRPNHGYTMDTVANPRLGTIDLQTGGPYTVANLATDYFFGGREPSSTTRGEDVSGVTSISNNTLSATFDQSHEGGRLDYDNSASFGISLAPTGRLIFTNNRSNLATSSDEIGQVITPSHTVFSEFDPTQNRPTLHESQSFLMPAGVPVASPNPVAFGTVQIGQQVNANVTITNNSDGLLTITNANVPPATDFSVSGPCLTTFPFVVLPHSSCMDTVTFKPTTTGMLNEIITIATDAGNLQINATGTASGGATVTVNVGIASNNTSGGTIVDNSTPPLINCFINGAGIESGSCSASYADGAVVIFTETPGPGAALSSWNGPCQTGTGGTTTSCTITVTNPIGVIQAIYTNGTAGPFTLTTALPANTTSSTGNGTVGVGVTAGGIGCKFVGAAPPVAIPPNSCSNSTEKDGEIIQLIPAPDQNSTFGGWAGTCPFQTPNTPNDCFVTMSQNQTVTPVFTIIPITLNVAFVGNGTVTSDVGGINCSNPPVAGNVCKTTVNSGTIVTLSETPGTGYSFAGLSGWSPSFCGVNSTATTCILTLNATNQPSGTLTMTATFTINTYLLNASTTGGTGFGTVTSNPNNLGGTINCGPNNLPPSGCGLFELFNAPVILMAMPQAGSTFTGWSASGVTGFVLPCATTTPCTFNMPVTPPAGLTVTATFAKTAAPALAISKSHAGTFTQGQQGAHYTVTVSNGPNAGPTSGTVTVTETAPAGLTLVSMAGTGWTCTVATATCTTTIVLNAGGIYPAITVTVNVLGNATSPQVNQVGVTGGGSAAASTSDSTTIVAATPPILQIKKSHAGNFTQGQQGAKYTVTVSTGDAGSTNGTAITVTDTVPAGLTLVSMAGAGWTCTVATATCTTSVALSANAIYPSITVTVNVTATATSPQVNQVSVSGGGATAAASTSDSTVITPIGPAVLTITKTHAADFTLGQQGAQYTVTVTNGPNAGPTNGVVTVTDAIPDGLSLVSMAGTGWTCTVATATCTTTTVLNAGGIYPAITVTVNVSATSPATVTNTVTVTGGGSAAANANDPTNVNAAPFTLVITPPAGGNPGAPVPISPGGQLALGLVLTPISGFNGTVTLSCVSSAPQFITCAPAPSTVKISVGGTQVAIVINTFCQGAVPTGGPTNDPMNGPGGIVGALELLLAALSLASVAWAYRRRSRWALSFAALMLIAMGSAACNSLPKGPNGATPPGNYTLIIKATANGQSAIAQEPIQVLP